MQTQMPYPHIGTRADGSVVIVPSGFKVRMLVQAYFASELNAEAVHEMYPELTRGQIHAALAYYWDHQTIVDAQIEALNATEQAFLLQQPNSLTRAELMMRSTP